MTNTSPTFFCGQIPVWRSHRLFFACVCLLTVLGTVGRAVSADPLPSWNEGVAKQAIIGFVHTVTDQSSPNYVSSEERIATFDNDGTLWAEKPIVFQAFFVIDQLRALASQHPEWKKKQPFKAILENDLKTLMKLGEKGTTEIMAAIHAGMTTEEFQRTVEEWIATATHPRFNRPFTDLVYQPMLELLAYLQENSFKTYIVSGGGAAFMRPWTEDTYGIPPEQVVGSTVKTKYEVREGEPVLVRLPRLDFIDDGPGKPVGIDKFIGRRPIAAFGNSDGDLEMLQWTAAGEGARFMLIVHHTDAEREYAYDSGAEQVLAEAINRGWTVVDMKNDFLYVFPFEVDPNLN